VAPFARLRRAKARRGIGKAGLGRTAVIGLLTGLSALCRGLRGAPCGGEKIIGRALSRVSRRLDGIGRNDAVVGLAAHLRLSVKSLLRIVRDEGWGHVLFFVRLPLMPRRIVEGRHLIGCRRVVAPLASGMRSTDICRRPFAGAGLRPVVRSKGRTEIAAHAGVHPGVHQRRSFEALCAEAGAGRCKTRGEAAGIDLRRQHGLRFCRFRFLLQMGKAACHALDHCLERREGFAIAAFGCRQVFADAGNRALDGLRCLHRQMFVLFEALRHLFEPRGKGIWNFRAVRSVDIFELLHNARDGRLERLCGFIGAALGVFDALGHVLKAFLQPLDGCALIVGVRFLLDRFQRRLDRLRAEPVKARLHLLHARHKLRQRTFECLRALPGVLAFGVFFRRLNAMRERCECLTDFAKRVFRSPLGGFQMVHHGVDGLLECLNGACIFPAHAAATAAFGALHALTELL